MKDQSDKFYFNNPDVWESLRGHSLEKETNFISLSAESWWHIYIRRFTPVAYLEKLPFEGNYFGESKEGCTEAGLKLTVK